MFVSVEIGDMEQCAKHRSNRIIDVCGPTVKISFWRIDAKSVRMMETDFLCR